MQCGGSHSTEGRLGLGYGRKEMTQTETPIHENKPRAQDEKQESQIEDALNINLYIIDIVFKSVTHTQLHD